MELNADDHKLSQSTTITSNESNSFKLKSNHLIDNELINVKYRLK